eukprot:COSAG06_NODE_173_length_21283_cov_14.116220_3_plen_2197_part_00
MTDGVRSAPTCREMWPNMRTSINLPVALLLLATLLEETARAQDVGGGGFPCAEYEYVGATWHPPQEPDCRSCFDCVPGQTCRRRGGCFNCTAGEYDTDGDPTHPCVPCPDGTTSLPGAQREEECREIELSFWEQALAILTDMDSTVQILCGGGFSALVCWLAVWCGCKEDEQDARIVAAEIEAQSRVRAAATIAGAGAAGVAGAAAAAEPELESSGSQRDEESQSETQALVSGVAPSDEHPSESCCRRFFQCKRGPEASGGSYQSLSREEKRATCIEGTSEPEAQPEAEAEAKLPEPEPGPELELQRQPKPEPQSHLGPEPEPERQSQLEPEPEPEPETEPDLRAPAGYGFGSGASAGSSAGLVRMATPPEPEPQSSVQVLPTDELHSAVFISYSRRDPGAMNAVNVIVNLLRWKLREDGTPYSRACHSSAGATPVLVPWMDKEQMAESGGTDWNFVLAEAQIRAALSVFFLSNAYCGSEECLKELQYADLKKFERVPVFLEWFVNDEETFTTNEISKLCDAKMQSFDGFEVAKSIVERLTFRLQGVPGALDLMEFTCDQCRGKRDTGQPVCARCTDVECAKRTAAWPKLTEMAESLGTYIDGEAVKQKLLPALDGQPAAPRLAAVAQQSEPRPATIPARSAETEEKADVKMAAQGFHTYLALQAPPLAIGDAAARATLHRRIQAIDDRLERKKPELMEQQCFPLCLGDASASNCNVQTQLRKGLIHCLAWCAKGAGFEPREDEHVPSLDSIAKIIGSIKPTSSPPRVAVVCLQYGAEAAAKQLHASGVPTVIWLGDVDMFRDDCSLVLCEIMMPAVQMLQDEEEAIDVVKFIRTEMSKLCRPWDMTACGCIGAGTVKVWEPAATARQRQWLSKPTAAALSSVNLDVTSGALKSLNLYACDLERLPDIQADLQRLARLTIVTKRDVKNADDRRRAVALSVCTASLHDRRYDHVLRVTSAEEMREASTGLTGQLLVWLDFIRSTTAADVQAIQTIFESDTFADTHVIMTCDDNFSATAEHVQHVDDLAKALHCRDAPLPKETGLLDVHADECVDDFKLLALFSEDHDGQRSLLDAFEAQQLAGVLQAQLQGRPIVGIYHANEANGILFRVAVTDVAFLHSIRDQFLQGMFGRELEKALLDTPRNHDKSLGELSIKIDQSHFAEQHYSNILRLNKLTAHQREQLEKVRSSEKSVHVKAPAGAGKTFIALHQMLELLQSSEASTVLFAAPAAGLVFFVVRWLAERVGGRECETNPLLSRLHLLFAPFDKVRVATIEDGFIETKAVEECSDYALIVVDEAHHIYRDDRLRTTLDGYTGARRMLLSDVSQGHHDGLPFPDDLQDVQLEEVVRCSKRVVGAASRFQSAGRLARCHHDSEGPPLKSFLYDEDSNADVSARFELCAAQTMRAIEHVAETFKDLDLNNRLAIIVPDADFRRQLAQPLERQLNTVYEDRFEMLNAEQASRICILTDGTTSQLSSKQNIIMDDISQLDGMEFLIVICVGLDTQMAGDDAATETAFAESRSRLYRGITRAHMLALAVNDFVPGGWLEYLTTVRLKEDTQLDQGGSKPTRMSQQQQARLDADKERRHHDRLEAEAFMHTKSLSNDLAVDEAAFIKQKILAAVSRPEHDLETVFANARSVEWPRQQQLDRIPQLVAEVEVIDDSRAIGAIRQLATVRVTNSDDMTAEQAIESALGSWDEAGTTLSCLIEEMELSIADTQLCSMQANVASARPTVLHAGREVAARLLLEQWVLDGEVQKALALLKQQIVTPQQLRPLQPIVTDNVRQGMSAEISVSAALALWQATEVALQALAVERAMDLVADPLTCRVENIIQACAGLEDDALPLELAIQVAEWEAREKRYLEAQKEEQSIWDPSFNSLRRMTGKREWEKPVEPEPEPEPEQSGPRSATGILRSRKIPAAARVQETFRSLSVSNYKEKVLDEHREPNSDWRTTLPSLDALEAAGARGRPDDLNRCASQDRALGMYRELLAARKFDELAMLVWTFGPELNLPEVYNAANSTLLCDDPGQLDVYSGFMSSVNRYIEAQPAQPAQVELFRGTSIGASQRAAPQPDELGAFEPFRQPCYAAPAADEAQAAMFATDGSPIIKYVVPAGFTRCAELPAELTAFPREREWLIMPYTGMRYVGQEQRDFPAAGVECAEELRKRRLVVTFELVFEEAMPPDAPSHLMVCEAPSEPRLFR